MNTTVFLFIVILTLLKITALVDALPAIVYSQEEALDSHINNSRQQYQEQLIQIETKQIQDGGNTFINKSASINSVKTKLYSSHGTL